MEKQTGFGSRSYEAISRQNVTGTDDDLSIDIQDAIGREDSLSLVADSINVTVEGEIVTLKGQVFSEGEKMLAGDIAAICAGEDNVNNYLDVMYKGIKRMER